MTKAKDAPDAVSEGERRHLEALEKGYIGENPVAEAIPNERYSILTGPEGVPVHHELALAHDALTNRSDVLADAKASAPVATDNGEEA